MWRYMCGRREPGGGVRDVSSFRVRDCVEMWWCRERREIVYLFLRERLCGRRFVGGVFLRERLVEMWWGAVRGERSDRSSLPLLR